MVSYYPLSTMYRQPQGHQLSNSAGWYHQQPPQQYLPCMGPDNNQYHPAFHHDWPAPQDCTHFQPSPPISEVSSSGPEGMSPPGLIPLQRPLATRSPYEWMKKASYQTQSTPGKTRTKDKYRVVYTDHQRLELEKEFHYSRYITIRRKAELAATLGLSERQVKIWFQNRRAKERKQVKKREETNQKIKQEMDPLQAGMAMPPMHVGMSLM